MTRAAPTPTSLLSTSRSPLKRPLTLAVIVGNRGFFPDHLAESGREIDSGGAGQSTKSRP